MTAIDVGRGDALLIEFPNGKHMLVDGGGSYSARHFVIPYLMEKQITHLDAIVCTHEHWDHIDGLVEMLKDNRITVDSA
jgi:competence protein ComEC